MNSQENTPIVVNTINELVAALSEGERTTYDNIMRSMDIPTWEFEDYSYWSDECYTRNCIVDTEDFELILLCWKAGQITPIHDHGGEECWVTVVEGEFQERIYHVDENNELSLVKSDVAKKHDVTYMIDFMGFHSLQNISSENSLSLHLYAKPIRNCNRYDEELEMLVNNDLEYTTVSESIEN